MKNTLKSLLILHFLAFGSLHSKTTVFSDTFDGALGPDNPNRDINIDYSTRQSGGETTSSYTKNGKSDAFLNTPAGGAFKGETVLLLRTASTGGSAPSNSGVITDTNFASALAGKVYTIAFTGLIMVGGKPSDDRWGSFMISDSPTAKSPNAKGTDYSLLYRDRAERNVTIWKDGAMETTSVAVAALSLFKANELFTVSITIDEVNGTVDTKINKGLANEVALPQASIDFENDTERYFGFRANQGAATGLVDFRYDNLTITIAP